jgi:hypothetical protein
VSAPTSWMIIGQEWTGRDGGVILLASNQLGPQVDLHSEWTARQGTSIELRMDLGGYLLVRAPTFAEALAKLFGTWTPGEAEPLRELE